jgi:hypothetical protein
VINKGSAWRLRVGERGRGGIYREDQGSSGWEKRWRVRVKGGRKGECQV